MQYKTEDLEKMSEEEFKRLCTISRYRVRPKENKAFLEKLRKNSPETYSRISNRLNRIRYLLEETGEK